MTNPKAVRRWQQLVALLGATGVLLGAFGAHKLKSQLEASDMALWQTAVSYLFWHTLAAWGVLSMRRPSVVLAALFVAGIALFCGSLFALALGAPRWSGLVTPVGGLVWLIAWFGLAWHAGRSET